MVVDSLERYSIGADEKWIAVLAPSVKTLQVTVYDGTFDASYDTRCKNLQAVEGGEGLTTIGSYAFDRCSSLSTVSFPKVTSIGDWAFQCCSNLSEASFPVATSIEVGAFQYCSNLRIFSLGTALTVNTNISFGCDVFYPDPTTNIDLTLGAKVEITATDLAAKLYKDDTFKSITIAQ